MANLFTNEEIAIYKGAIDDMHDTFARDIVVWGQAAETITIPEPDINDDYDYAYGGSAGQRVGSQSTIVYTPTSKTIKARIKYIDKQEKEYGLAIESAQNKINVTTSSNLVRIKVKQADVTTVENATKITIDNVDFEIVTAPHIQGIIGTDYYTYYLFSLI